MAQIKDTKAIVRIRPLAELNATRSINLSCKGRDLGFVSTRILTRGLRCAPWLVLLADTGYTGSALARPFCYELGSWLSRSFPVPCAPLIRSSSDRFSPLASLQGVGMPKLYFFCLPWLPVGPT